MSKIEVTVRRFLTTEEGVDVVPKATFLIEAEKVREDPIDLERVASALDQSALNLAAGCPLGAIRQMTDKEVDEYLEKEENEE